MKKTLIGLTAAAAIATPLAMAGSANAASVALNNPSFAGGVAETPDFPDWGFAQVFPGNPAVTGWTVGGNGIDYVGSLWDAADGDAHSIDLNSYGPGSVSQTVDTVAGQTYNVTFAMSGNPANGEDLGPKTMTVSATGNPSQDYTYDVTAANTFHNMMYVDKTFSFVGTGSSVTLTFTSTTDLVNGVRHRGPVIDNVRDTTAPDVVKTKVWNTWTGGPVSSTTAPAPTDSAWHPTKGDPQSELHRSDKHNVNEPYFEPKGKSGGAWFMWSETTS